MNQPLPNSIRVIPSVILTAENVEVFGPHDYGVYVRFTDETVQVYMWAPNETEAWSFFRTLVDDDRVENVFPVRRGI